jgi:nucleoside 2-deoxyribosyltransferase
MQIYVASSWRNLLQPGIVHALRRCGHDVYDFKNPAPGNKGFSWREIDPNWEQWTPEQYRQALQHPIAKAGYTADIDALKACDACVLLLPSGRSASWEFGYAMGQGKRGYVVQFEAFEPELMYREAQFITSMPELFDAFGEPVEVSRAG